MRRTYTMFPTIVTSSKIFDPLLYLNVLIVIGSVSSKISVYKIVLRTPTDGDIGLIFDINLINTANEEKELLEYRIRSDKECCVNLTENSISSNAGKVLGGFFGHIEPGAMQTVSVIWPTTAVFNRVGHCSVIISSTNVKNEEKEFTQQLQFDTRFTTIDSTGTTFRRQKTYLECSNWDMDFMNNCTPVNCQEKYLGKRSFYNTTTKMCEPVPKCIRNAEIYDIYANECIDSTQLMDAEDIGNIKRGKYENNTLDLGENLAESQHKNARSTYQEFVPDLSHQDIENPMWTEIISGLSLVFATIVIYTIVCFFIFLLVNWISKMSARPRSPIIIRKPP